MFLDSPQIMVTQIWNHLVKMCYEYETREILLHGFFQSMYIHSVKIILSDQSQSVAFRLNFKY